MKENNLKMYTFDILVHEIGDKTTFESSEEIAAMSRKEAKTLLLENNLLMGYIVVRAGLKHNESCKRFRKRAHKEFEECFPC